MEHEKEFDQNILYRKGHYKRPTKSQKYLKKVSQGLDSLKADSTTVTVLVEIQRDLITNKVWETHRNSNENTWTVMKRNPEHNGSMICVLLRAQATDKPSTREKGSVIKKWMSSLNSEFSLFKKLFETDFCTKSISTREFVS